MKLQKNTRKFLHVFFAAGLAMLHSCDSATDNNKYYTADDFYKIKKIDVHAHALSPDRNLCSRQRKIILF